MEQCPNNDIVEWKWKSVDEDGLPREGFDILVEYSHGTGYVFGRNINGVWNIFDPHWERFGPQSWEFIERYLELPHKR